MDPKEYMQVKAFRDLIASTIEELTAATTPSSLATAIEARLDAWEKADPDFAAVLRDLRSQVYSMGLPHMREVRKGICGHLKKNLERIDRSLNQ